MNEELEAIAARQYGVVTRAQALNAGLSKSALLRIVRASRLEELFAGVYRAPGSPRTGRQLAMAATLWAGEESAISYLTGARLLRLDAPRPDGVDLSIPLRSGLRTDRVVLHRTAHLPRADIITVDGIRCTTATRNLIDCAAILEPEALEVAFESARRLKLTSLPALRLRAGQLMAPGRAGTAGMRQLLAAADPRVAESPLEVRLARLVRASDLPTPVRQHAVGRRRIDLVWEPQRLGVECEGFAFHGGHLEWKRDRRRVAELERLGWRILVVTWDDVTKRPDETIERIRIALVQRSNL